MIIFLGDKPSPRMKENANPFEGATCRKRLYTWIETVMKGNKSEIQIKNQVDHDYFTMYMWYIKGNTIIALGNNASKALKDTPHFKLPHPSGRNRKLNDTNYIVSELNKCRNYLKNNA